VLRFSSKPTNWHLSRRIYVSWCCLKLKS